MDHPRSWIEQHTEVAAPFLCPEIKLRLITENCTLWRANEASIKALGIRDPYWGFCWAGGQALARYLLDHPEKVAHKRVLDFGAGGGVEAIAAAMAGASKVCAADVDPLAVEAFSINCELNRVLIASTTEDLLGTKPDEWDVILAGDVLYEGPHSERILQWLGAMAQRQILVLIGDPDRGHLPPTGLNLVASYHAPADVDLIGRHLREVCVYSLLP